jgi:hypothetical protein
MNMDWSWGGTNSLRSFPTTWMDAAKKRQAARRTFQRWFRQAPRAPR